VLCGLGMICMCVTIAQLCIITRKVSGGRKQSNAPNPYFRSVIFTVVMGVLLFWAASFRFYGEDNKQEWIKSVEDFVLCVFAERPAAAAAGVDLVCGQNNEKPSKGPDVSFYYSSFV